MPDNLQERQFPIRKFKDGSVSDLLVVEHDGYEYYLDNDYALRLHFPESDHHTEESTCEPLYHHILSLESQLREAQENEKRLRAIVKLAQWGSPCTDGSSCPICGNTPYDGHAEICLIRAALNSSVDAEAGEEG